VVAHAIVDGSSSVAVSTPAEHYHKNISTSNLR